MSFGNQVRRSARKSAGNDTSVANTLSDHEYANPLAGGSPSTSRVQSDSASMDDSSALPLVSYTASDAVGSDSSTALTKYTNNQAVTFDWQTTAASTVALVSSAQESFSQSWNITAGIVMLEMGWVAVAKIKFNTMVSFTLPLIASEVC